MIAEIPAGSKAAIGGGILGRIGENRATNARHSGADIRTVLAAIGISFLGAKNCTEECDQSRIRRNQSSTQ
jgi:hypothetical protein